MIMQSSGIKLLTNLKLKELKAKCPSVPEYALTVPKYTDRTANGLTKCIIDFIELRGFYATRINTMGVYDTELQKYRKGTTKRGTADIHACIKGKHLSIEVKIGADAQSMYQEQTEQEVIKSGGIYLIARTFDEFLDDIKTYFKDGK